MGILIVAAIFGFGLVFALALSAFCTRRFCSHRDSVARAESSPGDSTNKARNTLKQTP